jgi:hypothetical protein
VVGQKFAKYFDAVIASRAVARVLACGAIEETERMILSGAIRDTPKLVAYLRPVGRIARLTGREAVGDETPRRGQ